MKNKLLLAIAAIALLSYSCKPKNQADTNEPKEKCTVKHEDWTRNAVI